MCAGREEKVIYSPHPLNPGFLEEVNIKKLKKFPSISTRIAIVTKLIRVAPVTFQYTDPQLLGSPYKMFLNGRNIRL